MTAVPTPEQVEALAPPWLSFIRADEWGRTWKHAPSPERLLDPETFIHHTAGSRRALDPVAAMLAHQKWAQAVRGYATVAYDVLVHRNVKTDDVAVMGGREGWRSAATRDRNEQGEAICLAGYFHPGHSRSEVPSSREIEALAFAVAWSIAHGWSAPDTAVLGHRDNPAHPGATACPGDHLYLHLDHIRTRVAELLELALAPATPTPPPLEDPEMGTGSAIIWSPHNYDNAWLTGNGETIPCSPGAAAGWMGIGVPFVEEPKPVTPSQIAGEALMLERMLELSGMTAKDLVAT